MPKYLDDSQLTPGSVIAVRYTMYKHFAIVSDKHSEDNGKYMPNLISLSYRAHGVKAEPSETVVGNRNIEKSLIQGNDSTDMVLSRARSCIGKAIKYQLFTFNCEHFVRYAHGLTVESIQVKRALHGAVLGAASCVLLPNLTITRLAIMTTTGAVTFLRKSLRNI
jgi:hypothetical protein